MLTNSTNVRSDKKERILTLMEKYNFRPNAMARGLVDTKSKTIGIMVADIRNPFYSEAFVACINFKSYHQDYSYSASHNTLCRSAKSSRAVMYLAAYLIPDLLLARKKKSEMAHTAGQVSEGLTD